MIRTAVWLALIGGTLAGSLGAQARGRQRAAAPGLWYAFGVGAGWARVTCAICAGERDGGITAFAAVGGTASRGLRIGGEVNLWRGSDGDVSLTLTAVGAVAYWFPNPRGRFYLKGGAVYVSHRAADGIDVITSSGIGPLFGAGREFMFGRRWRLVPFVHVTVGAALGGVKFNGGTAADRATVTLVQAGVSLTRP